MFNFLAEHLVEHGLHIAAIHISRNPAKPLFFVKNSNIPLVITFLSNGQVFLFLRAHCLPNDAYAPDVALVEIRVLDCEHLALHALWGLVICGAFRVCLLVFDHRIWLVLFGAAVVDDFAMAVGGEHNVVEFDVSVSDVVLVDEVQPSQDLKKHLPHLWLGDQFGVRVDEVDEVFALAQLHDYENAAFFLPMGVVFHDVGVRWQR